MSGWRRSQMLDAIISALEDAGYVLPAQKISDIRQSEWDLGQDHAIMSAESVDHLAAFIRDQGANGRLPIIVHQSGHVALDWDDRLGRRLLLTFLDDGRVQYEASMLNSAACGGLAAASGTDTPKSAVARIKMTGAWAWAMGKSE